MHGNYVLDVWGFPQKNPSFLEIACTVYFHGFYFHLTNKCTIFDVDSFLLFITLLHVSVRNHHHHHHHHHQ